MTAQINDPMPVSPVQPVQLALGDNFRFRCHKGIACFNRCCENADVLLTRRLREGWRATPPRWETSGL
ncbi:MAG: hypothetical protein WB402_00950 [Sulfuricaulis sp.]|uniref:hypothetical protein n=1 Tax=Sulfuricaulis sp. TaxID=2003553 RepID=UPI003C59B54A